MVLTKPELVASLQHEVHIFGQKASRGAFLVTWVLCGCAELDTMNLWAGIDASAEA